MFFHRSLNDSKSPQVSRTLLSILPDLSNVVIWIVSPRPLISRMETDYFVIVAGVLQGDILAPFLFIICLDYVLRTSIDKMKDNGFKLAKERSRKYLPQTITDTDYADDIALLANTVVLAITLPHSLERAAVGIGLHVNADKTEYMSFNLAGDSPH